MTAPQPKAHPHLFRYPDGRVEIGIRAYSEEQQQYILLWFARNKKEMFDRIVCPCCASHTSAQERIDAIIKLLYDYENELSDGFGYYSEPDTLKRLAEAIALLQEGRK